MKSFECVENTTYEVVYNIPDDVGEDIIAASNELINEGKLIAYIKHEDTVIALVSYKE